MRKFWRKGLIRLQMSLENKLKEEIHPQVTHLY